MNRPDPKSPSESELMHDVRLMLEHLFHHEEVLLKTVIDRLVDVGSVNLIERKIKIVKLRRPLKRVTKLSKPALNRIALFWVQRNCPKLIADWLYTLVAFEDPVKPVQPSVVNPDARFLLPPTQLALEASRREIAQLRTQVRVLAGTSVAAVAALGLAIGSGSVPIAETYQTLTRLNAKPVVNNTP